MTDFELQYERVRKTVEKLVYCKVSSASDAEDVLQNILLAAWQSYPKLENREKFKPWILSVAQHKIKDYYAEKARMYALPLDEETEVAAIVGYNERETAMDVRQTLEKLGDRDKQILYLYYLRGYAQKDIAIRLNLPLGTVKSRLHNAKKRFIDEYGEYERPKERTKMNNEKKFPEFCPEYKITEKDGEIFEVVCEEIPGWLAVPRVGEKCSFAFYYGPDGKRDDVYEMAGIREAKVHGINCVQVKKKITFEDGSVDEGNDLFVKLTDSHCLYVAAMWLQENGSLEIKTFLGDDWDEIFGVGDNNCGRETHQRVNRYVVRNEDGSLTVDDAVINHDKTDLIGRYEVDICGKKHDTVAMMNMMANGIAVIQYLNRDGRTVLFRRFDRNDRQYESWGELYTEMYPDSERMTIGGETYVHWYDCIPDHVLV